MTRASCARKPARAPRRYTGGMISAALALLLTAGRARGQYLPPRVEVARLPGAGKHYPLEPSQVVAGDCRRLELRDPSVRVRELAVVRVTADTPWYVGVGSVARDKAGELGANCVEKRSEWGRGSYPLRVSYRAYLLDRQVGFGSTAYRAAVPRSELAALATAASPPAVAAAPAAASPPTAGDAPLWTNGDFIFRFEIGMDTAKFPDAVWRDVAQDFREYFPPAQYAVLLRAHARGGRILVDFKNLRITELR